jgi:hypothetical protein
MEGIRHISTFKTVTRFLLDVAEKEILHGHREELTRWKGRAGEFKKTLLDEMKKYARQQYPFNERFDSNQATITWWKRLEGGDYAQILPVSTSLGTNLLGANSAFRSLQSKYFLFVLIQCPKSARSRRLPGLLVPFARE